MPFVRDTARMEREHDLAGEDAPMRRVLVITEAHTLGLRDSTTATWGFGSRPPRRSGRGRSEQAGVAGGLDGGLAVAGPELAVDRLAVGLHGVERDVELVGDLAL